MKNFSSGSVYLWSPFTLHGTKPGKSNETRISIRYLIQADPDRKENVLIDHYLENIDGPIKLTKPRNDLNDDGEGKKLKNLLKDNINIDQYKE